MLRHTKNFRVNQIGSFVAELPLSLSMLLLGFTFPLMDLASVAFRTTFLIASARDGVHQAARSKTFLADTSPTELSAQHAATQQANATILPYPGVRITNVVTDIVQINLTTHVITRFNAPLALPADTSTNAYNLETSVTGQVDPLLMFSSSILGNVPGLTGPITTTATSQEFCEYPQGLNQ